MRLALLLAAFAASHLRDAAHGLGWAVSRPFLFVADCFDALAMQLEHMGRASDKGSANKWPL